MPPHHRPRKTAEEPHRHISSLHNHAYEGHLQPELIRILDVGRRIRGLSLIRDCEKGYMRSMLSRFTVESEPRGSARVGLGNNKTSSLKLISGGCEILSALISVSSSMGNYSIVIQDSILLGSLKGKKSTLIVGCAGCANVSTAYEKNLPVFKVEVEEKTGNRTMAPYAIRSEAERLKRLLESNKIKAEIVVNGEWCGVWTEDKELSRLMGLPPDFKDRSIDSVLVLTCVEGVKGVNRRIRDDVKVVPGMLTVGGHQSVLAFDEKNEFVLLDRDKSTFIKDNKKS